MLLMNKLKRKKKERTPVTFKRLHYIQQSPLGPQVGSVFTEMQNKDMEIKILADQANGNLDFSKTTSAATQLNKKVTSNSVSIWGFYILLPH